MSENQNNKGFAEKMKNAKVNRASVITALLLLTAIAVIISVTVAANRSKDKTPAPNDIPKVEDTDKEAESETSKKDETSKEHETSKPTGGNSSAVVDKLPSFTLPVDGVLAKKHDPEQQVYSSTLKDYRVHLGIDITTSESAPVHAAAAGTVSKVWKDDLMGYSVAISHNGDCYTIYQNLSDTLANGIKEGATVTAGQLIGSVGDSAMVEVAEEPHLHFEMTVADLLVDPLAYFSEADLASLNVDSSFE